LLTAAAVRYAMNPDERHRPLLRSLTLLTLSTGGLGSILGIIHYFAGLQAVKPEERALAMAQGLSITINAFSHSLVWIVFSLMATSIGAWRASAAASRAS